MEIVIDEDWLIFFYNTLVGIYRDTDTPITVGYNKGMISVCIKRPLTDVYNLIPFPHILHKATVLMETIIDFHPFADGNKRVALLATFFFLYWNGYDFVIPENAADFSIEIAEGKHKLNTILLWMMKNSRRTFSSILRNEFFTICVTLSNEPFRLESLLSLFAPIILPVYPLTFFWDRIRRKRAK